MTTTRCLNGEIQVGDIVVSIPSDEYACLIGVVTDIKLLGAEDRDTENEDDDIYVDFTNDYSKKRIAEIEKMFQILYDDPKKTYDECWFDMVIMDPGMLLKLDIDNISEKRLKAMLDSEAATSAWCFNELLKRNRVEVETEFGTLFAEISGDPSYPGIYTGLRDNEDGVEKTLALVEAAPDHLAEGNHSLRLLVWRGMDDMVDYTDDFTFLEKKPDNK